VLKILIIGGCGYIGARLTPHLKSRGHEVEIVDLCWFGRHVPAGVLLHMLDARSLTVDDMYGFDQVIYIAGMSNDPMADHAPYVNYVANAALPAYLADIARRGGVKRFIHGSSCSVYGFAPLGILTEDARPETYSPYGVSKLMAEFGCAQHALDMEVINLRQGTLAGWSPRLRLDLVLNAMVASAISSRALSVNDPQAQRPLLFIDDAIDAYTAVIESTKRELSGTYNLVSRNTSVSDIAKFVAEFFASEGLGLLSIKTKGQHDIRSYKASAQKFRGVFDWVPRATLHQTVAELVFKLEGVDLDDDNFYNIRTFKALPGSPAG